MLRIVGQMIDVTKISDLEDEGWQRTARQFLDDTRHEPVSRISASFSLFERVRVNMFSVESGVGG